MKCVVEIGNFAAYVGIHRTVNNKGNKTADKRPFLPTVMNEIEKRRGSVSKSTLENELTAVRSFVKNAGRSLTFSDLTPELIQRYEKSLLNRGLLPNTSACYLRSLRAVLNRCQVDGSRLFGDVHTGREETEKRAADEGTIRKIKALCLKEDSVEHRARVLFIFSIMAMGIPFVDLAHLRKSDVRNGYIIYHRRKTGKRVKVKMEPCMQKIIDRFGRHDGSYLFPLLKTGSEREYLTLLSRYNRALGRLSAKLRLSQKLTSYTVRHTWATMAYCKGTPLAVISKALGHSSPVVTQNYLKEIDDEAVVQANSQILREINGLR